MNSVSRIALIIITVAALFVLTGCSEGKNSDDSQVPWSRPASWEHQMPGFGGMGY